MTFWSANPSQGTVFYHFCPESPPLSGIEQNHQNRHLCQESQGYPCRSRGIWSGYTRGRRILSPVTPAEEEFRVAQSVIPGRLQAGDAQSGHSGDSGDSGGLRARDADGSPSARHRRRNPPLSLYMVQFTRSLPNLCPILSLTPLVLPGGILEEARQPWATRAS